VHPVNLPLREVKQVRHIVACDLGTSGAKTSIFRENGARLAFAFRKYETFFSGSLLHEQRPDDWWNAFCSSVRHVLAETGVRPESVAGIALSGHANVNVPLDAQGNLLSERVPIWSDRRAVREAETYFERVAYEPWYQTTGSGDPPEIYAIMKLLWMREHEMERFHQIQTVLGSKDYVNYRLTGELATDYSYASGSGAFGLAQWDFDPALLEAAELPRSMFPKLYASHEVIGQVTANAARLSGLMPGTPVMAGGVDNACMALGAVGDREGGAYLSLGSSAWIAVVSEKPVLDLPLRPFLFAHAQKGMYASGVSIFSAGSSHRWARDRIALHQRPEESAYDCMNRLAAESPPGARGVLFNPTLGGGSTQNPSARMCGGFAGLTLSTGDADLVRAVMEGVALDLSCYCLDPLKKCVPIAAPMYVCGGGAKSALWCQILADTFGIAVQKSDVDQDTAALGAAALAMRGAGITADYAWIPGAHTHPVIYAPGTDSAIYQQHKPRYMAFSSALAALGDDESKGEEG